MPCAIDYTVHPATRADYPFCYRLCKRSMQQLFEQYWGGWKPASFRQGFEAQHTSIIRIANRRAGWFAIRDHADHRYLNDIYLSSRYRGQGLGTAIVSTLMQAAPQAAMRLTCFRDNPALNLYLRLGFTIDQDKNGVLNLSASCA